MMLTTTAEKFHEWLLCLIDTAGHDDDDINDIAEQFPDIETDTKTYCFVPTLKVEIHEHSRRASRAIGLSAPAKGEIRWYLYALAAASPPPPWMRAERFASGEARGVALWDEMVCRLVAAPSLGDCLPVRIDYLDAIEPWIEALKQKASAEWGEECTTDSTLPPGLALRPWENVLVQLFLTHTTAQIAAQTGKSPRTVTNSIARIRHTHPELLPDKRLPRKKS
jgi:hypothetical protein